MARVGSQRRVVVGTTPVVMVLPGDPRRVRAYVQNLNTTDGENAYVAASIADCTSGRGAPLYANGQSLLWDSPLPCYAIGTTTVTLQVSDETDDGT